MWEVSAHSLALQQKNNEEADERERKERKK
jgi:hypothetical protein